MQTICIGNNMKLKALSALAITLILTSVLAYIPPTYDNVTLVLNETAYVPPSYNDVTLVLEAGAAPPPTDSCDCPSPPAHWYMDISDNCNITSDCDNKGFNVYFENGTTGDMVNCSAMIIADNFYMDDAGSGAVVQTDPACYLNTTT